MNMTQFIKSYKTVVLTVKLSFKMSLSKELDVDNVVTKINKVYSKELKTDIHPEEIASTCCVVKQKAISIKLILHLLGGPNMNYRCIDLEESFEAFDHLRSNLVRDLSEQKNEILFFEDRKMINQMLSLW